MRRRLALLPLVSACLALGCTPPGIPGDEMGSETSGDSNTTPSDSDTQPGTDTNTEPPPGTGPAPDACASALDILFVVDNSGSMAELQRRVALAAPAILEPLELRAVDWRIAVTTSDNGNPWCPAGATTPEGGKFVASSCRERPQEFSFNESNAQERACSDFCELPQIDFLPSTTQVDPAPSERPWLESIGGELNISEGSAAQALACMLPMGINGCGFESQLESMYLGLVRSQTSNEQNYGFVRPEASLLVIIVSDEVDCSYNKEWSEIFEQDGNRVFWSDPNSAFPSSAVCWNAGVSCVGDPSGYDACIPTNKDANGSENVSDADAVLHPLSRYQGILAGLEAEKQNLDASATVRLAVLGGADANGGLSYADVGDTDPAQQDSFGIGPGCVDADFDISALPPVRMRNVAYESDGQVASACAPDYDASLAAMLEPFFAECD